MKQYSTLYPNILRNYSSKYNFTLGFVHLTQRERTALFQPDLYQHTTLQCYGLFCGFTANVYPEKSQKPYSLPRLLVALPKLQSQAISYFSENIYIN